MPGLKRIFCFALLLSFIGAGFLFSAERYALVIGNGDYRDPDIASLVNPVNDATDVASAVRGLGFNVTLVTNVAFMDMLNAIRNFAQDLKGNPDNEGFFWFAGHGLSVRGVHYLLPVDVNPVDETIIARGSYSVDELMEEIGNAHNVTNLIVIDACRNNLLPTGRSMGSRGLTVLASDDYRVSMNKVVYSTMAGRVAADGIPGSRNSPFAQAFLTNIQSPEIFDDVFVDIRNETMRLTNGDQQPYAMGSFAVKSYSLNPAGVRVGPIVQAPPPVPGTIRVNPGTAFILDNKKGFGIGLMPAFNAMAPGISACVDFTFYEHYNRYGDYFVLPNSFFVSAVWFGAKSMNGRKDNTIFDTEATLDIGGFSFGLGALYKIRLGAEQRFILSLGPSLEIFMVNRNENVSSIQGATTYSGSDNTKEVSTGLGVQAALSYRFSPLFSLDLGLSGKFIFSGVSGIITEPITKSKSDNYSPFDEGIPFSVINIGIAARFWFVK